MTPTVYACWCKPGMSNSFAPRVGLVNSEEPRAGINIFWTNMINMYEVPDKGY